MDWIKAILPLIGVFLGWFLSERGKIFYDKRQDSRKLKKLLYFLLDLRFHFAKELSIEKDLDRYISILKNKIFEKYPLLIKTEGFENDFNILKPLLQELINKMKQPDSRYEDLSENIDKIIVELAEVFPILAYELSGHHNIKERLTKANSWFTELENSANGMPINVRQLINPKLTIELLRDLDLSIERVSEKIDKETARAASKKISKMTFDDDQSEVEQLIDELWNNAEIGDLVKFRAVNGAGGDGSIEAVQAVM